MATQYISETLALCITLMQTRVVSAGDFLASALSLPFSLSLLHVVQGYVVMVLLAAAPSEGCELNVTVVTDNYSVTLLCRGWFLHPLFRFFL